MKLEKWALIAEVVSGLAVVLTLIFVLLELRTNNDFLERQLNLDRIDRTSITVLESEYLPDIIEKIKEVHIDEIGTATQTFMDRYDLSFVEADRFTRYLRQQWQGFEADYLAGARYPRMEQTIAALHTFSEQALYWDIAASTFDPGFVEFVEQTVAAYGDSGVEGQLGAPD